MKPNHTFDKLFIKYYIIIINTHNGTLFVCILYNKIQFGANRNSLNPLNL